MATRAVETFRDHALEGEPLLVGANGDCPADTRQVLQKLRVHVGVEGRGAEPRERGREQHIVHSEGLDDRPHGLRREAK
eukprot:618491-Rhodomonas_salina.1